MFLSHGSGKREDWRWCIRYESRTGEKEGKTGRERTPSRSRNNAWRLSDILWNRQIGTLADCCLLLKQVLKKAFLQIVEKVYMTIHQITPIELRRYLLSALSLNRWYSAILSLQVKYKYKYYNYICIWKHKLPWRLRLIFSIQDHNYNMFLLAK